MSQAKPKDAEAELQTVIKSEPPLPATGSEATMLPNAPAMATPLPPARGVVPLTNPVPLPAPDTRPRSSGSSQSLNPVKEYTSPENQPGSPTDADRASRDDSAPREGERGPNKRPRPERERHTPTEDHSQHRARHPFKLHDASLLRLQQPGQQRAQRLRVDVGGHA